MKRAGYKKINNGVSRVYASGVENQMHVREMRGWEISLCEWGDTLLSAGKVKAHGLGDTLPIPDLSPLALVHELPDRCQHLQEQVAVAQSRVAPDSPHGVLDL